MDRFLPVNILMVEDNEADIVIFQEFCESYRICNQVTQVKNGDDALLYLKGKRKFGLIIVDINLPGMPGLELIKQAKALPGYQEIPVIILTGHETKEQVETARLLEVKVYMVKPITEKTWEAAVDELKKIYRALVMREAA